MTPLYLQHIALRQFRSFATLDVDLEPRPGVLIVHGSNGLGKSSLFDAMEWALSDRIDHFRDANGVNKPGTYLCRWREGDPGPTSTTMTFSGENIVERSLLSAKSTKSKLAGNVPDIAAFLRAPAWQQRISELQRYLLLTHFLGQSTISRLTYRKSTERFDILKEAAQSTAIEAIANALHGQGNNTVVRAYARQIEALERDAKALDDLLEQEATLWAEAQMSGAIDEPAAAVECRRIETQLRQAQLIDRRSSAADGDSYAAIDQLRVIADEIEHDCFAAEGRLADGRRLYSERQRTLTDVADVTASRAAIQARLDLLTSELNQAREVRNQARMEVTTLQQAVDEATADVARLRALRDARATVARLITEHSDSIIAESQAEQAMIEAERNVTLAERKRQIVERLTGEIGQCDQELDRLRERMATIELALACEDRIAQQSNVLAQLEASSPNMDEAVERAAAAASAAADSASAQVIAVSDLRETVDSMSNAIASIATHLPADSCDCPLCATHFESASVLQARVSSAAERLAPALAAQEVALSRLSAAREARVSELQQLQTEQSAIRSARVALADERERRAWLIARLDADTTDQPETLAFRRTQVADTIAAINASRRRKLRWQTNSALGSLSSNADHSRAVRARDAARRTLDAAARKTADLSRVLEQAESEGQRSQYAVSSDRTITAEELLKLLEKAEATARGAQDNANKAALALTRADATSTALEAEEAGLRARLEESESRQSNLNHAQRRISDDWLELGRFGSEPELAPLQTLERRIAASRLAVKEALGQLARLREGRLIWARQVSHRAVLEQIREKIDGPPNGTRGELLMSAALLLSQKTRGAEDIAEVKEIARAASADISAELEDFNSEYIKPLSFLMSQINRVILCDPRVGIDLHVKKKKIEQSAVKAGEVPKALGDIDPLLVHSEGQMAALAVSMLCAASLTFPWSRWKALVLDDPLQHNDSIHAAAFADLMGNLISAEGYQILLSTHDTAQAEFLLRKFRSRRIPCTTLNLLGIGKEGVEWSIQSTSPNRSQAASA